MSTICLAAQRSYACDEAVYFTWRLPAWQALLTRLLVWLTCASALLACGLYAHRYWQYRHPAPPEPVSVKNNSGAQLSDMHYVYITKAFPPLCAPAPHDAAAPENDDDWMHTPDGSLATKALPDAQQVTEDSGQEPSLQARFMQALKEQQQDYAQGKIPQTPENNDGIGESRPHDDRDG